MKNLKTIASKYVEEYYSIEKYLNKLEEENPEQFPSLKNQLIHIFMDQKDDGQSMEYIGYHVNVNEYEHEITFQQLYDFCLEINYPLNKMFKLTKKQLSFIIHTSQLSDEATDHLMEHIDDRYSAIMLGIANPRARTLAEEWHQESGKLLEDMANDMIDDCMDWEWYKLFLQVADPEEYDELKHDLLKMFLESDEFLEDPPQMGLYQIEKLCEALKEADLPLKQIFFNFDLIYFDIEKYEDLSLDIVQEILGENPEPEILFRLHKVPIVQPHLEQYFKTQPAFKEVCRYFVAADCGLQLDDISEHCLYEHMNPSQASLNYFIEFMEPYFDLVSWDPIMDYAELYSIGFDYPEDILHNARRLKENRETQKKLVAEKKDKLLLLTE